MANKLTFEQRAEANEILESDPDVEEIVFELIALRVEVKRLQGLREPVECPECGGTFHDGAWSFPEGTL